MALFEESDLHSGDSSLVCELCSKRYRRPDLLVRHRRRCQGPKKLWSRRKACEACVKAKAKCCYTQPTCTRCLKRGKQCIYSSGQNGTASSPVFDELSASSEDILDPEIFNWNLSSTPLSLSDFDLALSGDAGTIAELWDKSNGIVFTAASIANDFTSYGQVGSTVSPECSDHNLPLSRSIVEILSAYPSMLMRSSFLSPLLHIELYSLYNGAPDMTFMAHTAMAIACGSGIKRPEDSRFFRRAIDAARQRAIGNFPSVACMQQWDHMHALLIFEAIELRESLKGGSEDWSHDPKVNGLGSPFLLKIARRYLQPYDQVRNRDYHVFEQPTSSPCQAATTPWARWKTVETVRRTVFLANILNYYSNRNYKTGKQMPFYEALNDHLILNMPLPCSEEAWVARSEEDWVRAMDRQEPGGDNYQGDVTLRDAFNRSGKDQIRVEAGERFGLGGSEELRRLIILAATEQFLA